MKKLPAFIPGPAEVGREVIIVLAGALGAAIIVGMLPAPWKAWIKAQWADTPH